MNINKALNYGRSKLQHLPNPTLETEVLLSHLMGQNRPWIKIHTEASLGFWNTLKFKSWIKKRANHLPLAYITGYKIWNDLKIFVTHNTLIPRDETETLCHHIKKHHNQNTKSVLDIGTGSGCIALWCAKQFPQAQVHASDISQKALNQALKNAKFHHVPLNLIKSDLLNDIPKSHFDIIVANLPYVPKNLEVSAEVEKEPHSALFSGSDGLNHIRTLAMQISEKDITFNALWLEFLPQQKEQIQPIFSDYTVNFLGDEGGTIFFACIKS